MQRTRRTIQFVFRQPRGQHRTQRQRDEGGNCDRDGQYKAELRKQPPRHAGQKGDWQKHRNKRRRRRQHRKKHLTRADYRRRHRFQSEVPLPLNIFHHNDGVIDDHARRQH